MFIILYKLTKITTGTGTFVPEEFFFFRCPPHSKAVTSGNWLLLIIMIAANRLENLLHGNAVLCGNSNPEINCTP